MLEFLHKLYSQHLTRRFIACPVSMPFLVVFERPQQIIYFHRINLSFGPMDAGVEYGYYAKRHQHNCQRLRVFSAILETTKCSIIQDNTLTGIPSLMFYLAFFCFISRTLCIILFHLPCLYALEQICSQELLFWRFHFVWYINSELQSPYRSPGTVHDVVCPSSQCHKLVDKEAAF